MINKSIKIYVHVSATVSSMKDETEKGQRRIIRRLYAEMEHPTAEKPRWAPLPTRLTAGRIIAFTVWLKRLGYQAS